jgi:hypothetical protein
VAPQAVRKINNESMRKRMRAMMAPTVRPVHARPRLDDKGDRGKRLTSTAT